MFTYTIDTKPEITDTKGNTIVDFVKPIFTKNATNVADYKIRRVDAEKFQMRPDLISIAMYGDDSGTEYILKYSGISNPFTLNDDDVLMIPNDQEVYGMMRVNHEEETDENYSSEEEVRNNYKFYNPNLNKYTKDQTSYNNLTKMNMPSGIIDKGRITNATGNVMVPYISEDGKTAVTIRNGRVYFGEDSGLNIAKDTTLDTAANITSAILTAINNTITKLSDSNCIYNGTNLADFVRSNFNS